MAAAWKAIEPYVRGETPSARWGRLAIVGYAALCVASVVWGLSGGMVPGNELGATVELDTRSGYPSIIVDNRSGHDWSTLRIVLDDRYYHRVGAVAEGRSVAVSLVDFNDGWILPRPRNLFPYERAGRNLPSLTGDIPPNYQPINVRLVADQGEVSERLR